MAAADYNRTRVLVIEDELSMAELLRKGLEDQHYSVTVAYTGTDGLQIASKSEFSAIILDVILPGVDGYLVASGLRRAGNDTPILMLTAMGALAGVYWEL